MEYVRLPRVTVSDYLTNTNVRQLFASRANIVSERRWRRLLFEDASTLQFAKHSPPNTLNVRTNIHELFGQTCSTKNLSIKSYRANGQTDYPRTKRSNLCTKVNVSRTFLSRVIVQTGRRTTLGPKGVIYVQSLMSLEPFYRVIALTGRRTTLGPRVIYVQHLNYLEPFYRVIAQTGRRTTLGPRVIYVQHLNYLEPFYRVIAQTGRRTTLGPRVIYVQHLNYLEPFYRVIAQTGRRTTLGPRVIYVQHLKYLEPFYRVIAQTGRRTTLGPRVIYVQHLKYLEPFYRVITQTGRRTTLGPRVIYVQHLKYLEPFYRVITQTGRRTTLGPRYVIFTACKAEPGAPKHRCLLIPGDVFLNKFTQGPPPSPTPVSSRYLPSLAAFLAPTPPH
ncbi:hypothetical protein J6590_054885 [Homalodisca vitripennis]|nr:hypothetical protein J6590_054885 [Homalodisca vitripennis]